MKEACFRSCSGGVPRGSSSSFPSPNECLPSALGGAVGGEVSEHRAGEGGTETAEVVRSAVQRTAVCFVIGFHEERAERKAGKGLHEVCLPSAEGVTEPEGQVGDLPRE